MNVQASSNLKRSTVLSLAHTTKLASFLRLSSYTPFVYSEVENQTKEVTST
jgi:hypothetical protein